MVEDKIMNKNVKILNRLLSDELAAACQYRAHATMCESWGLMQLHALNNTIALAEEEHAQQLRSRIIALGGTPYSAIGAVDIVGDVYRQHVADEASELRAIASYEKAIQRVQDDPETVALLTEILENERVHQQVYEERLNRIHRVGVEEYIEDNL